MTQPADDGIVRLSSPVTIDVIDQLRRHQPPVTEVWFLWYDRVGDLTLLDQLPNLRRLNIVNRTASDLSAIKTLRRLRALSLHSNSIVDIDLSAWPMIEELAVTWSRKFDGLASAHNLINLCVWRWKESDLQRLAGAPQLRNLEIIQGSLRSLAGVEHCVHLKELALAYLYKLTDFRAISDLKALRRLQINACKKLNDLTLLSGLPNLEDLDIDRLGEIESLTPLRANQKLRRLFFGDTNVLDGNTAVVNEIGIEHIGFRNRKHYNYKYNHLLTTEELNLSRLAGRRVSAN